MKVRYANEETSLIETGHAHKLRLPVAVVQSARRKIRVIRQAADERDLRSLRSLHYEKLGGKRDGQRSIRLNDQWRLILHIDRDCDPLEIEILEISNHYE
ncbi:MAG: plasmid maintenance system killer protein [bacterium]|nr:plasmid maintenance system killer protein [bacterium]